ncbi:MAG: hypothetical protein M3Y81_16260 [Chloroflexota bacterium]|nr:hypothetical protein [Chloroflexota bacterium]
MTFVSVAQACHRLGIDAKTLHRWLADAQLALHCYPHDGRKKGLSGEHLHLLACLHQRSLAPLPQEPPAPVTSEVPPLPASLLAVPEQVSALQAQIAALQQQMADLIRLLQQQTPSAGTPAPLAKPSRRSSKPAYPVPRSRPAATTPRKPTHVIPRVEYGGEGHSVVICPKHGVLPLEPDTPEWFAWLTKQSSFRFMGRSGHFTAHHEGRVPRGAWRAHRHIRNHGYSLRLAPSHELTLAVLEQAAATL